MSIRKEVQNFIRIFEIIKEILSKYIPDIFTQESFHDHRKAVEYISGKSHVPFRDAIIRYS